MADPPDPKLAAGLNCTVLCTSLGVVVAVTRLLHSNTQIILWAAAYLVGILQYQKLKKKGSKRLGELQKEHLQVVYHRAATTQWAVSVHQTDRLGWDWTFCAW